MSTRPHYSARLEDAWLRLQTRILQRFGWQEAIVGFTGIGTPEYVRILGRVVLRPPSKQGIMNLAQDLLRRRGWRNFVSAPLPAVRVRLLVGEQTIPVRTDRGGYIDVRVKNPGLAAGWHQVQVTGSAGAKASIPLQVVSSAETFGIVCDIDDTIISTWLPRPLIAAWNSFILTEQARQAVPGMARMLQQLLADHPGAPVVYVSTGAWNTYPMVNRFLARHGLPDGAMLLTDWGPTNTGWFRSGAHHKRTCLRELARDLPNIQWLLVGDDGQHDPELYAEFATLQPEHVRARAIRQLSPGEHALASGGLVQPNYISRWRPDTAPEVRAPDGDGLADKLRGIL